MTMAVEHFELEVEVNNVPVYVSGWVSWDGHLTTYLDIYDYYWDVSSSFIHGEEEGAYYATLEDGTEVEFTDGDVAVEVVAKMAGGAW